MDIHNLYSSCLSDGGAKTATKVHHWIHTQRVMVAGINVFLSSFAVHTHLTAMQ